jgi:hypothetical protein
MNTQVSAKNLLIHYGVKGQKWGVTRKRPRPVAVDPLGPTRKLSTDELQKVVNRMRLEQQYLELARSPKTSGGKYAQSILENSGRSIVNTLVQTFISDQVRLSIAKKDK